MTSAKLKPSGVGGIDGAEKRRRGAKAAPKAMPAVEAMNSRRFIAVPLPSWAASWKPIKASWKIDQAVADGVDDQLGSFVNADNVHDIGAVNGDRVGTETQVDGNFLVGFSRDDMLQNFQLAGCENRQPRSPFSDAGFETCGSRMDLPSATVFTALTRSRSMAFFRT